MRPEKSSNKALYFTDDKKLGPVIEGDLLMPIVIRRRAGIGSHIF